MHAPVFAISSSLPSPLVLSSRSNLDQNWVHFATTKMKVHSYGGSTLTATTLAATSLDLHHLAYEFKNEWNSALTIYIDGSRVSAFAGSKHRP